MDNIKQFTLLTVGYVHIYSSFIHTLAFLRVTTISEQVLLAITQWEMEEVVVKVLEKLL
jgi:hypothetical protein